MLLRLDQLIEMIYKYEGRWGIETFAMWGAVIITLLVLIQLTIESLRLGFPWYSSLVRAFLWTAWVFSLVYCLILQAPLWMTLILSLGLGIGGKMISSFIFVRQPNRTARRN